MRLGHTSDGNIDTVLVALPGTWHYRVSARTGWPTVDTLGLNEIASLIRNFCLSSTSDCLRRCVSEIIFVTSWDMMPLRKEKKGVHPKRNVRYIVISC